MEYTLSDGGWAFDRCQLYRNTVDVSTRSNVTFQVKAKNDAHILLSEEHPNNMTSDYVEIVLGGWDNSKSIIRVGNMIEEQIYGGMVQTSHLLSADNFRAFWISWAHSVIQVGKGLSVGENMFMAKNYNSVQQQIECQKHPMGKDYTSPISIIYMSVWNGFGSSGSWIILPH